MGYLMAESNSFPAFRLSIFLILPVPPNLKGRFFYEVAATLHLPTKFDAQT